MIQGYATKALAAQGSWQPVVAYYVKCGLEALEVVNSYRRECGVLTAEDLAPALDLVRACGQLTPGAALALGFAGWKEWSEGIRSALLSSPVDNELAQACSSRSLGSKIMTPLWSRLSSGCWR